MINFLMLSIKKYMKNKNHVFNPVLKNRDYDFGSVEDNKMSVEDNNVLFQALK